jgi:ribA/ribD-fused uncharacterized protein
LRIVSRENSKLRRLKTYQNRIKENERKALHAKFTSHADLKEILMSTNDEQIVEQRSGDYYWGCGTDGTGRNRLGVLLMELRNKLRQEAHNS